MTATKGHNNKALILTITHFLSSGVKVFKGLKEHCLHKIVFVSVIYYAFRGSK